MLSSQDTETQLKVAQLCKAISDYSDPKIVKQILEKTVALNYVLPDKCFPVSSKCKVESGTVLHLAYIKGNIENFEVLIKSGTDYTIKDQHGSTILHHIIEDIQQENEIVFKPLNNSFVNMILSAYIENQIYTNLCNENGLSDFHVACMANNVELVELFLNNGTLIDQSISIDSPIKPGYSALHFAAEYCSFETIEFLISKGANMYLKSANELTPLHLLVEQRLYPSGKKKSVIATLAEIDLNEKIIKVLLENDNNDTGCLDGTGLLNFQAACTLSESSTVERFLEQVTDINQLLNQDSPIWPGYTALHFAAHCNANTVKMLIERGGNIMAPDAKRVTPFDICMKWFKAEDMCSIAALLPQLQSITFSDNTTKLLDYIYSMLDLKKLEKFLHNNFMNFNIHLPLDSPLWPGSTLLHLAFHFNEEKMLSSIVRMQEIMSETAINFTNEDCLSHLHIACTVNNEHVQFAMEILRTNQPVETEINLQYKGIPLSKLKTGWTPLHVAAAYSKEQLVADLLLRGADVNCKDAEGFTPIHRMFSTENEKVVELLLESKNLQECVVEGTGLTHLHVATWFKNDKAVERLLQMGANIEASIKCELEDENLKKLEGCTPLHLAVIKNDPTNVRMFLKNGANILAKRSNGSTPLSEAMTAKDDLISGIFMDLIRNDKKLQKQLEEEFGLTMLHIACCVPKFNAIDTPLREKNDNVNAKTRDELNFWPGFTPLHVFVESLSNNESIDKAFDLLKILLVNAADVTATNAEGRTPVHLAFKIRKIDSYAIKLMLNSQRDFSINPMDKNGISHFHCACAVFDLESVKKFLQHGHIDVNQQINFFAEECPGYSPLHLVLSSREFRDDQSQLQIIELLLQYGAKISLEDSFGQTPLHVLFREIKSSQRLNLMRILFKYSNTTDLNIRTIDGKSPMEILLSALGSRKKFDVRIKELELLISHGGRINTCNPISELGYIALAFYPLQKSLRARPIIFEMITKTSEFSGVDEMNRNSIHNAVATPYHFLSQKDYDDIVDLSIKNGRDIDEIDCSGKTALHLAVQFGNSNAAAVLLTCGAEINIADFNGKSAFSYIFKPCKSINYSLVNVIALHVYKLKLMGIEVSNLNDNLLTRALKEFDIIGRFSELDSFFDTVRETENVKISRRELTLRSCLLETAAISLYPSLTPIERDEIATFFESFDYSNYSDLKFAIKLQYRKVMQRVMLIKEARDSLKVLLNFSLPDLCVEVVLEYLRNSDLKNLAAAYKYKDDIDVVIA